MEASSFFQRPFYLSFGGLHCVKPMIDCGFSVCDVKFSFLLLFYRQTIIFLIVYVNSLFGVFAKEELTNWFREGITVQNRQISLAVRFQRYPQIASFAKSGARQLTLHSTDFVSFCKNNCFQTERNCLSYLLELNIQCLVSTLFLETNRTLLLIILFNNTHCA